jgi:hypothetical protein
MSWDLIRAVQGDTDVRLILPFGLALRLGDVISVGKDGNFTLQGNAKTLLGVGSGRSRTGKDVDIEQSSGKDTSWQFRAAGEASSVFPNLPAASASLDVSFRSAGSWVLAVADRTLRSYEDVNRFRVPILDAYGRGVWKPDWALITEIGTAGRMTLLASRAKNTNVALSLGATATASAGLKAQLTSGVTIAATSQQITQCITTHRMPIACRALRVRDPWWLAPYVGDLARGVAAPRDALDVSHDEFWEDVDDL